MSFDPQNPPRDFKGIWIPKEIWLDQSLDFFEKSLFAEIHSLDGPKGCYADNPYFCKFFNVNERTLQRGLKKLKEYKYIFIESFDGRKRILRSNMKNIYDKFDTSDPTRKNDNDKFDTPPPTNLSPTSLRESIEQERILERIIEESSLAGAKESAAASKPSARIARAPHVSISSSEHQELVEKFGEEMTQRSYQRLSEWKQDTPKSKWKKNDKGAIMRWVIEALKEDDAKAQKASKTPENRIKEMQEYLRSDPLKIRLEKAFKAQLVKIGNDYIDFLKLRDSHYIKFTDKNAEMMIDHNLRKMGY